MKSINIFCFGFGQVAKNFIRKIINVEKAVELNVSSRQKTHFQKLENLNYKSFQFDKQKIDLDVTKKILEADYILVSIPPVENTDIVIKYFGEILKQTKPKWITYLSATSVYGNHNGEWVNENSKTKPTTINGMNRLAVEKKWLEFSEKNKLPIQIFRLSGIYSTQFNILKRLLAKELKIVKKKNHFFSRIHVEDIANILLSSLHKFKNNEIFNISDDKPASQEEVAIYGSNLLKIETPKFIEIDSLEEGMLKDFYKDSKKVDNKKMKFFFNYELKHPTYVEGLEYIFNNGI